MIVSESNTAEYSPPNKAYKVANTMQSTREMANKNITNDDEISILY